MKIIHIGYYNEKEDLEYLINRTADEVVEYYNNGFGNFFRVEDEGFDVDEEIKEESITSDKQYVVIIDKDCDSNSFIDIYKIVSND